MLRRGGTWFVVTHDWPVGVGTTSESMPRDERYRALNEIADPSAAAAEDGPEETAAPG